MDKLYNLTITHKQLRIMERALDLYIRVGIGQFEALIDSLEYLFPETMKHQSAYILREQYTDKLKNLIFDFHSGGSYGISNPSISDEAKIAYDMDKVIQKMIAVIEDHHNGSVWHHGDLLHLGSEPSAKIEEQG